MIELIPAIDIMDGKCVRLTKGDYNTQTVYSSSPVEMAKTFEAAGIRRLHVVDLDGAKSKHVVNLDTLKGITASTNLAVDFGGGIKTNEDIEKALFGKYAGHPALGAAEYALSDTKSDRGVYTFCMCPGGEVVAAASEEGGVVVNGMSRYKRDGVNSNSAVAVSVMLSDIEPVDGSAVLGAIAFQRSIEMKAFSEGGSDYRVPVQTVGDFLKMKEGSKPGRIMPTYMGGDKYKLSDIDRIFPEFITNALRYGILSFDRKIKGFARDEAVLSAPETRTSSPLRILRTDELTAVGKRNIYPCGEGAGYAGGITSAAVDGVKVALEIMKRWKA